ncbi:MAG: OmpA family protein [Hyphomicrobiales bacterium]
MKTNPAIQLLKATALGAVVICTANFIVPQSNALAQTPAQIQEAEAAAQQSEKRARRALKRAKRLEKEKYEKRKALKAAKRKQKAAEQRARKEQARIAAERKGKAEAHRARQEQTRIEAKRKRKAEVRRAREAEARRGAELKHRAKAKRAAERSRRIEARKIVERERRRIEKQARAKRNQRRIPSAVPVPVDARTISKRQNPDGTITTVRRRADGAVVRTKRDRYGNVISRKVHDGEKARPRKKAQRKVVSLRTYRLRNGRTRTVKKFSNGNTVVIVRGRDGHLIRRKIVDRNGFEKVVFERGDRRRVRYHDRDINIFTPLPLPIPADRYVVESERTSTERLERTFRAPPVYAPQRGYSIDEVKRDPQVRSSVRRIDLDTLTFATGDARIPHYQINKLARLAETIHRIVYDRPGEVFLIEGHTDAVGSDESNLYLSIHRANSVRQLKTLRLKDMASTI